MIGRVEEIAALRTMAFTVIPTIDRFIFNLYSQQVDSRTLPIRGTISAVLI